MFCYFAKYFAKYITHSGFWGCVCVCVWICLPFVCNNFLVYSITKITKTILPGPSPHLVRTFLMSIPLFLLLLGSFGKTRWPPCQFFNFIFPIDFLLQTRNILTVKLLLPSQPMHPHYKEGRSNNLILHCREHFQPFQPIYTKTDIHFY